MFVERALIGRNFGDREQKLSEIRLKIRMVTVEYSENGGVNDCKEYFADYDVIEMTRSMSHSYISYLYESLFILL